MYRLNTESFDLSITWAGRECSKKTSCALLRLFRVEFHILDALEKGCMHNTHIALEKGILYTYVCMYIKLYDNKCKPSSGLKPFFRAISGVNLLQV